MNRKQRKIKKMVARRHSGHTAIVPKDRFLGRECLLKMEFGEFRSLGWSTDKLAKIIGVSSCGETFLVHCPALVPSRFGHTGGGVSSTDRFIKDARKFMLPYSCWWVNKKDLRFK